MNRQNIENKIKQLTAARDAKMREWEDLQRNANWWNKGKREKVKRQVHELNGQKVAWEARLQHASNDSESVIFIKRYWLLILIVLGLAIYRIFFY